MHLLHLFGLGFKLETAVVEAAFHPFKLVLAPCEFALLLVELMLTLLDALFTGLSLLHLLGSHTLRVVENLHLLLFGLENPFLFYHLGLAFSLVHYGTRTRTRLLLAQIISREISYSGSHKGDYYPYRCVHLLLFLLMAL